MSSSSYRQRKPGLTHGRQYTAEEQALNQIVTEADEKLAAKRAVRDEARKIRLEMQKQANNGTDLADDDEDEMPPVERAPAASTKRPAPIANSHVVDGPVSRNGPQRPASDSSPNVVPSTSGAIAELKHQIDDLEARFKEAMMTNASLDNEKQALRYELEVIKDRFEELRESYKEVSRSQKQKARELNLSKRDCQALQMEVGHLKAQLEKRDELMQQCGLAFLFNVPEGAQPGDATSPKAAEPNPNAYTSRSPCVATLVSADVVQLIGRHLPAAAAHLDVVDSASSKSPQPPSVDFDQLLRRLFAERSALDEQVKKLTKELEEERERNERATRFAQARYQPPQPASVDQQDSLKEAERQIKDLKARLQVADQEKQALEATRVRLDTLSTRLKRDLDESELNCEQFKADKRKLDRENRDLKTRIEELNTEVESLKARMERLRSSRTATSLSSKY